MSFPCRGCGACCRRIGMMPPSILEANGLTADERGHCVHLDGDSCTMYALRPEICRVKGSYKLNAAMCNAWMSAEGRIDLIRDDELEGE